MSLGLLVWLPSRHVTIVTFKNGVQTDGVGVSMLKPMVLKFSTLTLLNMTKMLI